jgi:uncharacterized membrane protein
VIERLADVSQTTVILGFCLMAANFPLRLASDKIGTVGAWLVFFGICENVAAGAMG